jgi:hypothetical protein
MGVVGLALAVKAHPLGCPDRSARRRHRPCATRFSAMPRLDQRPVEVEIVFREQLSWPDGPIRQETVAPLHARAAAPAERFVRGSSAADDSSRKVRASDRASLEKRISDQIGSFDRPVGRR